MIFTPTLIEGAWLIETEPVHDARGSFARTVCVEAFGDHGLDARFVQQSVSHNTRLGILRGMHYQAGNAAEDKLVRATRGAVYDVMLDLRPESGSYLKWQAFELSEDTQRALYIPKGVAHGFQTLTPVADLFYQMTTPFVAEAARGIRWDDPEIGIAWPHCQERLISDKDRLLPTLAEFRAL